MDEKQMWLHQSMGQPRTRYFKTFNYLYGYSPLSHSKKYKIIPLAGTIHSIKYYSQLTAVLQHNDRSKEGTDILTTDPPTDNV